MMIPIFFGHLTNEQFKRMMKGLKEGFMIDLMIIYLWISLFTFNPSWRMLLGEFLPALVMIICAIPVILAIRGL